MLRFFFYVSTENDIALQSSLSYLKMKRQIINKVSLIPMGIEDTLFFEKMFYKLK